MMEYKRSEYRALFIRELINLFYYFPVCIKQKLGVKLEKYEVTFHTEISF